MEDKTPSWQDGCALATISALADDKEDLPRTFTQISCKK
jgi:hypothetical protein